MASSSENNPRGFQMLQVSIAMGVLASLAVALRVLARWRVKASFALDDWFLIASLVPFYGMLAISKLLFDAGLGLPVASLDAEQTSRILKILMGSALTWISTITIVKLSLILLYRRIFATPHFRRASLVVGTACVAWFLISFFLVIFQCHPISAFFNPDLLYTDHCIDFQAMYRSILGSNIALDLILLCLPLYMVLGLQLALRQKLLLSGIFALGSLTCITGIIRVISLNDLGVKNVKDISYTFTMEYIYSQIEPATAIICACLVTYRPLFKDVKAGFSRLFSTHGRTSGEDRDLADNGHTEPSVGRVGNSQHSRGKTAFQEQDGSRLRDLDDDEALEGKLHIIEMSVPPSPR